MKTISYKSNCNAVKGVHCIIKRQNENDCNERTGYFQVKKLEYLISLYYWVVSLKICNIHFVIFNYYCYSQSFNLFLLIYVHFTELILLFYDFKLISTQCLQ
jgi:hypothetical protein